MSYLELQDLLTETKTTIKELIEAGRLDEAALAMDALVQIQADLIKALTAELSKRN